MSSKSIRLSEALFKTASRAGQLHHRSATGQLEYWAELGRSVERFLDPVDVLKLTSGAAELVVKAMSSRLVSTDEAYTDIEEIRAAGTLRSTVSSDAVSSQASAKHPGYHEKLMAAGSKRVGRFEDGKFVEGF